MEVLDTLNWGFLEIFFGEHGKLIAAVIGLLIALISLIVAVFRHRHAQTLERILGRGATEIRKREEFYEKGMDALKQAQQGLENQQAELTKREQRLNDVRAAFHGKEEDLWCLHEPRKPPNYSRKIRDQRRKPIVLVANLKGGVGKSTLTANLAAHFTSRGKRVLLVDGDYQGSLSNMLLSADGFEKVSPEINKLLAPGANLSSFESALHLFRRSLAKSSIIAATYELATTENRLMIEYLLGEDGQGDDRRYRLARLLLSEEVSDKFDMAFIDAPPRLTAATINGFCASTHLLVPTVYDKMSAEAVGTFLNAAQTLKSSLNHAIDLLGVVGMLTRQQGNLSEREQNARNAAIHQVSQAWGPNFHFFERHIPRKEAIAKAAGEDIAYFCDANVTRWFDSLGQEISNRLWNSTSRNQALQLNNRPSSQGMTDASRSPEGRVVGP